MTRAGAALLARPPAEAVTVLPFDGDGRAWDAFVDTAPEASFVHLSAWHGILGDALGAECTYLVARDGEGAWRGVLPLARVKSRLFGHYLVSLPFLNYGGPIGVPAARRRLTAEAVAIARRTGADLLELRTRHDDDLGVPSAARKITVLLDLPDSPEALWRDVYSTKLRTKIRRALKEEVDVRVGAEERGAFYDVFARNMRDLGTPVLPRAFFEAIAAALTDRVLFAAVHFRGEPIAAGCGFVWRDEFEMTWSSGVKRHGHRRPNLALYAACMEHLIARGVRVFNFGRSTPGTGPHEFKRQWGGRDVPLPWCAFAPGGRAKTPSPGDGGLASWGPRMWRRLPLPVANRLGPRLSPYLP